MSGRINRMNYYSIHMHMQIYMHMHMHVDYILARMWIMF